MTRAKFKCTNITDAGIQTIYEKEIQGKNYSFSPVMADKDENGKFLGTENTMFGIYTPAGSFNMTIYNDDVEFELNQEYYLDITPAN